MNNHSFAIVQHLWNCCNALSDYEIEKELNETLPCWDDMVHAERLQAAYPKNEMTRDVPLAPMVPASARQGTKGQRCWKGNPAKCV
jgi:hypothetical protein